MPDGPGFVIPYEKKNKSIHRNIIGMTNNFLKKQEEEARWQNAQFAQKMKKKKKNTPK